MSTTDIRVLLMAAGVIIALLLLLRYGKWLLLGVLGLALAAAVVASSLGRSSEAAAAREAARAARAASHATVVANLTALIAVAGAAAALVVLAWGAVRTWLAVMPLRPVQRVGQMGAGAGAETVGRALADGEVASAWGLPGDEADIAPDDLPVWVLGGE